jgi:hypothetical protein
MTLKAPWGVLPRTRLIIRPAQLAEPRTKTDQLLDRARRSMPELEAAHARVPAGLHLAEMRDCQLTALGS